MNNDDTQEAWAAWWKGDTEAEPNSTADPPKAPPPTNFHAGQRGHRVSTERKQDSNAWFCTFLRGE